MQRGWCLLLIAASGFAFECLATGFAQETTVKVFILAGQSNMEGKAKNELYEHQAQAPQT